MKNDYAKFYLPVSYFDNDGTDYNKNYMISLFGSFGYHLNYYNAKTYKKKEIKEMAKKQMEALAKKSTIPLYLFGSKGKYIITPSKNYFPVDLFVINEDGIYEHGAPYLIDMLNLKHMSPVDFLKQSLLNIGAMELLEKLAEKIIPLEKYLAEETELRKLDKSEPEFELRSCLRKNDRPLTIRSFNTKERAMAYIEHVKDGYSKIVSLKSGEVVYQDKTE